MIVMEFGGTSIQDAQTMDPCRKLPQGLKAKLLLPYTAQLKSCPDTCLASRNKKVLPKGIHLPVSLRASLSPWWILCEVRR